MTERPYTDTDLRHEAARQHKTLTEDPDFMGIGEQMEAADIASTVPDGGGEGRQWDDLPEADFDAAQRAIDDLLGKAADVSEWAINLGADGLEPSVNVLGMTAGDTPIVRVHMAFHPDMDQGARAEFAMQLGAAMRDIH